MRKAFQSHGRFDFPRRLQKFDLYLYKTNFIVEAKYIYRINYIEVICYFDHKTSLIPII